MRNLLPPPVELTDGRVGGRVGEEPNHITARKPGPLYKSFNILSVPGGFYHVLVNPVMQKKMFGKKPRLSFLCLDAAFTT
jgi:hypothetical protein